MTDVPKSCKFGGETKPNGNCTEPGEDGLPVQCVGAWSEGKHEHLRRYIEATRAVRGKYLPPTGRGGAAFIDIFAGPGRARVHDRRETIPGSPLLALEHASAPFTRVILCELDPDNVAALRTRTRDQGDRVSIVEGDCNANIADVVQAVPKHGLNIAFIDPFAPSTLKWTTVERLGSTKRMDLLIHFPTGATKRNFHNPGFKQTIDEMLGTSSWREHVRAADEVARLIDVLHQQLVSLGYESERVRSLGVTTEKNVLLYHLVFASKNPKGTAIWKSITRHDGPQRSLL